MTAPSWPLATRLEAQIRRSQVKTEYRNRATTTNNRLRFRTFAVPLYSVRDATTSSPPDTRLSPVLILDRQSGNVEGTASMIRDQRLRQLINEGGLYRRGSRSFAPLSPSPTTRSPYQVDLIIDRSFQKFFHPAPIPPIPQREYSISEFNEQPRSPLLPIPPIPTPLPRHSLPLNTSPISSTSTPIYIIREPIHLRKGDSVNRPTIRQPWSTKLTLIKRARWRGTSKRKQKNYTTGRTAKVVDNEARIPPRREDFSHAIRPSSAFKDEFSKYPKNTDILTDIAIPERNRLKPKTRYKLVPRPRSSVENETDTSHLTHITISPEKLAHNGIENAIYEDILVQERKALSQRNTPLLTDEVDFDDSIDSPQSQGISRTTAPLVLLEQRRKGYGSTGHRNKLGMTPERFYFKWDNTAPKNRAVFTKVVSMQTTPLRMTTVSGVISIPTTTDPLEGALVEEPLTKDEGTRQIVATVKLKEVEQKELEPLEISNETITLRPSTPLTLNVTESINDSFATVTSQPNTTLESRVTEPITVASRHSFQSQSLSDFDNLSVISNSEIYRGPRYYYEKNPENDTIQEEATIISTMRSPYWTSDPPPSGFQVEVIPFPKSNPVDGPLIAVDKAVTIKHSSSAPTETTTSFPTLIESSPEFIGPLPPESGMNRARAMGVKIVRSVSEPVDSMVNVSAAAHDNTEAVSVLKLSETIVKLSHCEVYSLCLDELSREEKACGAQASRIVTHSQRKQRSSCSKKLLPDYKAVDAETRSLEESYSACIKNRLGQNIAEVKATQCTAHSLPTSLGNEPCRSKVHVLKQHCSRLAKCCPDAQTCRSELDRSDTARYLRRRKESLALAATKCRIHKYRELFKNRNLLSTDSPLPS
ncbi:hypothetical protein GCK32_010142 [Trichostrongylus colubriformis]|uniref:Uncharacterized protein n=1 Tax=Trichostrongylus colubriformis TaxID=6319 RepID=A0AAN8FS25_TRICO